MMSRRWRIAVLQCISRSYTDKRARRHFSHHAPLAPAWGRKEVPATAAGTLVCASNLVRSGCALALGCGHFAAPLQVIHMHQPWLSDTVKPDKIHTCDGQ